MNVEKRKQPKLGEWLLKRMFPEYTRNTAPGDFEEVYANLREQDGIFRAWVWYWIQIVKSILPFIINCFQGGNAMFKNYLIIALRNIKRSKIYSVINIFGLAVGMACCIVIMLFVQDELSYDRFHENADRIYRVANELNHDTGVMKLTHTFPWMAPELVSAYPEIEDAVRISRKAGTIISYGSKKFEEEAFYADPSIFSIFTFPLLRGDEKTALKEPNSVVITKTLAEKIFGIEDPVGKTITINNKFDFKITGILREVPYNSHFRFDFLASYNSLREIVDNRFFENYMLIKTYLLLKEDTKPEEINAKLHDYFLKRKGKEHASRSRHFVQPLTSIHLHSDLRGELGENGNVVYSYGLSAVALLILIIACINFMNLSTARASRRSKEIGLRKVIGAQRIQLLKQFLGESVFLSFIALFFAVILSSFLLRFFNSLMNRHLTLDFTSNLFLYLGLIVLAFFVGFLSGGYPAFFLSAFKPADVLKKQSKRRYSGGTLIRKGLVVFQFTISLLFIVGTIIIMSQMHFIRNKSLGFQKDYVIKIISSMDKTLGQRYDIIRKELMEYPGVINVTGSFDPIGVNLSTDGHIPLSQVVPEGFSPDEPLAVPVVTVGKNYFEFFNIEIVDGRDFSVNISSDRENALLFNEAAVKEFGWDNPIGKKVVADFFDGDGMKQKNVIGVVKDFHYSSLREEIKPALFIYDPERIWNYYVRISSENVPETLSFLQKKWSEYTDKMIFSYSFLEEDIEAHYKKEDELNRVFRFSSLLAISIACLGLFGLALFTVEQRAKEIGIRKVLGATISSVIALLSKEFLSLIVIANVLAWPIIYFVMKDWLQNFAYRINIGLWIFLAGALLVFVIALITVSFQSIKAALKNPVDTLRYE